MATVYDLSTERHLVRNEIWATDKWRELFGFEKSERLDVHRILQKLHPKDREAVSKTFSKALATCRAGSKGEAKL
jgi:hypothetical protein